MRFEIRHRFDAPPERVEAAMFSPDLPLFLATHMTTARAIEPLERREERGRIVRRVKYVPAPLISSIGPKKIDPAWMAWVEESTYDPATRRMEFRNVPVVGRVRELLENRGTLELRASGCGTERVVSGELKVKVFLLGRIAESIIHSTAAKMLDDEARALAAYLREKPG